MNKIISYFLISFSLCSFLFAQIEEEEPNDNCGGDLTIISTFNTYTGELGDHTGSDSFDYWELQTGSSGDILFEFDLIFGEFSYMNVLCYTNPSCIGDPTNTYLVENGNSQTITLNSSYNYFLEVVANDFDGAEYEIQVSSDGGVLPVELIAFSGNSSKSGINLIWETATEVNNYGFEIERQAPTPLSMTDESIPSENEGWDKIAFVQGHGNSNSPKYYSYSDNGVSFGKFNYRLKQIDIDGSYEYSDVVEIDLGLPSEFSLLQNYPNPFNPTTTIKYTVPASSVTLSGGDESYIQLKVYDVLGKEVVTLVNQKQSPGNYSIQFDGSKFSSGIYYFQLKSGDFLKTMKMTLMK